LDFTIINYFLKEIKIDLNLIKSND